MMKQTFYSFLLQQIFAHIMEVMIGHHEFQLKKLIFSKLEIFTRKVNFQSLVVKRLKRYENIITIKEKTRDFFIAVPNQ